jgi:flagellar assembly factor FliW
MPTLERTALRVQTSRFGTIEVDEQTIIDFPRGMIGFDHCTKFIVVENTEPGPFRWLQALEDARIAFPVIDPWTYWPDYAPSISDADAYDLDLDEATPKIVLAIVTVPRDNPLGVTANLLGPVVINPISRRGLQVIVLDERYATKHSIVEAANRNQGG